MKYDLKTAEKCKGRSLREEAEDSKPNLFIRIFHKLCSYIPNLSSDTVNFAAITVNNI